MGESIRSRFSVCFTGSPALHVSQARGVGESCSIMSSYSLCPLRFLLNALGDLDNRLNNKRRGLDKGVFVVPLQGSQKCNVFNKFISSRRSRPLLVAEETREEECGYLRSPFRKDPHSHPYG